MKKGMALINLLSPSINMHDLLTVLHIFLMVLVGRIWIHIKTPQSLIFGDHFLIIILLTCMFDQVMIL